MTNTPTEGPATTGTRALTPDETLIATRVNELVEQRMAAQRRTEELRRRSLPARARRIAPLAAVAALATPPGQQALAAGQNAAVAAGEAVGHAAVVAGEAVGNAAVDGAEAVGHAAVVAGEAVGNAAVDGAEAVGHAAVVAGEAVGHAAEAVGREAAHIGGEIGEGVAHTATSVASTVSGWAVETWHSASDAVTTAAHAVGGWAAQYGDQIAAHPGNAAVTAGLGAAAVVAATPALRQGIGKAIQATSRWASEAKDAVKQQARALAVGAAMIYQNMRGIEARTGSPKATHAVVSEVNNITGGEPQLPSVAEVREALATPGSDPAIAAVGSKQPEVAAQNGQTSGSGEAQRTGAVVDPNTKNRPAQGL
ncbi:hypothetical protein [Kribbella sp. NPDC004536]|uniref:hypothetical protein n=1 Tax=Kribbella sp. NPDC004536 TaxID=3364106 RepID=UPI0036B1A0F7